MKILLSKELQHVCHSPSTVKFINPYPANVENMVRS